MDFKAKLKEIIQKLNEKKAVALTPVYGWAVGGPYTTCNIALSQDHKNMVFIRSMKNRVEGQYAIEDIKDFKVNKSGFISLQLELKDGTKFEINLRDVTEPTDTKQYEKNLFFGISATAPIFGVTCDFLEALYFNAFSIPLDKREWLKEKIEEIKE